MRTARRIRGLTQLDLAERVGVDHSFISLLESGKRDIRDTAYEVVVRMAQVLGVEPTELWPIEPLPVVTPSADAESPAPAPAPETV